MRYVRVLYCTLLYGTSMLRRLTRNLLREANEDKLPEEWGRQTKRILHSGFDCGAHSCFWFGYGSTRLSWFFAFAGCALTNVVAKFEKQSRTETPGIEVVNLASRSWSWSWSFLHVNEEWMRWMNQSRIVSKGRIDKINTAPEIVRSSQPKINFFQTRKHAIILVKLSCTKLLIK